MLYLSMPNASPSWHRECAAYGRTGTSQCPDIISLGQTEAPNSLDLPAYGRTETPTSPDLPAYGRTETSNSPDLPAYSRTESCLWPDRETNLGALRRTSLPMAGPATRFGTYKVTEWREGVQPQKTWIQKRIWKPRSSRFSSPTSIVCQGLVQTGFALHPHV